MASFTKPPTHNDDRRAKDIYRRAAVIIRDKGFDATSMGDIADAVDLTKGGLYYYIKGKQALLYAIMSFALERVENEVLEPALSVDDPETRLARWVGKGQAMKLALGFPLKAEEAYRIGLAQWLVPHDQMMAKTMEVAEHVASLPPLASRMVKESMTHGLDVPNIADASLTDLYRFMCLEFTNDKAEAHQAWRDRRKPVFKGE